MSDPASPPTRRRLRGLGISLAGMVGLVALVIAGATIWLALTDPITVAEAVDTGEYQPLVEELAAVIYNALKGIIGYL